MRAQIEFQAKALDGVRVKEARLLDGRLVIVYVRDTHVGPYESATAFPIDLGD